MDDAYLRAKFHLDPSNRLATIHQRYRDRTGQTDRQRSDSIGRTVFTNGRPKSATLSDERLEISPQIKQVAASIQSRPFR